LFVDRVASDDLRCSRATSLDHEKETWETIGGLNSNEPDVVYMNGSISLLSACQNVRRRGKESGTDVRPLAKFEAIQFPGRLFCSPKGYIGVTKRSLTCDRQITFAYCLGQMFLSSYERRMITLF
jgi:hypothetical protein